MKFSPLSLLPLFALLALPSPSLAQAQPQAQPQTYTLEILDSDKQSGAKALTILCDQSSAGLKLDSVRFVAGEPTSRGLIPCRVEWKSIPDATTLKLAHTTQWKPPVKWLKTDGLGEGAVEAWLVPDHPASSPGTTSGLVTNQLQNTGPTQGNGPGWSSQFQDLHRSLNLLTWGVLLLLIGGLAAAAVELIRRWKGDQPAYLRAASGAAPDGSQKKSASAGMPVAEIHQSIRQLAQLSQAVESLSNQVAHQGQTLTNVRTTLDDLKHDPAGEEAAKTADELVQRISAVSKKDSDELRQQLGSATDQLQKNIQELSSRTIGAASPWAEGDLRVRAANLLKYCDQFLARPNLLPGADAAFLKQCANEVQSVIDLFDVLPPEGRWSPTEKDTRFLLQRVYAPQREIQTYEIDGAGEAPLKTLQTEIDSLRRTVQDLLRDRHGITGIEAVPGVTTFDPRFHESSVAFNLSAPSADLADKIYGRIAVGFRQDGRVIEKASVKRYTAFLGTSATPTSSRAAAPSTPRQEASDEQAQSSRAPQPRPFNDADEPEDIRRGRDVDRQSEPSQSDERARVASKADRDGQPETQEAASASAVGDDPDQQSQSSGLSALGDTSEAGGDPRETTGSQAGGPEQSAPEKAREESPSAASQTATLSEELESLKPNKA